MNRKRKQQENEDIVKKALKLTFPEENELSSEIDQSHDQDEDQATALPITETTGISSSNVPQVIKPEHEKQLSHTSEYLIMPASKQQAAALASN